MDGAEGRQACRATAARRTRPAEALEAGDEAADARGRQGRGRGGSCMAALDSRAQRVGEEGFPSEQRDGADGETWRLRTLVVRREEREAGATTSRRMVRKMELLSLARGGRRVEGKGDRAGAHPGGASEGASGEMGIESEWRDR